MGDTPAFLARLGLRPDADARDIRRAYARELKGLDQERDAANFQDLREAYDVALAWARRKEQQERPADQPPAEEPLPEHARPPAEEAAPPASAKAHPHPDPVHRTDPAPPTAPQPAPELGDPEKDSYHVLAELGERCTRLYTGDHAHALPMWVQALEKSLHDPRLLNLDTRTHFEARLVHLLAEGWRPGLETLLLAAIRVFGWESDRSRLDIFGQAGQTVARAIDERYLFDAQPADEQTRQLEVIERLRAGVIPAKKKDMAVSMYVAAQLATRFPNWLSIIVGIEPVQRWKAGYDTMFPSKTGSPCRFSEIPAPKFKQARPAATSSGGISKFGVWLAVMLILQVIRAFTDHSPAHRPYLPPLPQQPTISVPAPARSGPGQTDLTQDDLRKLPLWSPGQSPGAGVPFPPAATQPPPRRLERTVLDAIDRHVHYRPLPGAPKGEYRVVIDVELQPSGEIASLTVKEEAPDPEFTRAVERGIRATAPFAADVPRRFSIRSGVRVFDKPAPPASAPASAPEGAPAAGEHVDPPTQ
ncbi:MAG: hypothetical protein ACXU8N_17500 [Telluria sp.]